MTKPKPKPKGKVKPAAKTNSGSNNEHAKLSPSHFETNLRCPASLTMEHGLPNESSDAAAEGTAMHHVAECCINNFLKFPNQKGGKDPSDYVGTYPLRTPNNGNTKEAKIQFTSDMAKLITPYVNYVKEVKTENPDAIIELEMRLDLTEVLGLQDTAYSYTDPRTGELHEGTGIPTFGTGDLVMLLPVHDYYLLEIDDLKTGRGKVYAEGTPGSKAGNFQLMGYAAAAYRHYTAQGYNIKAVRLGIFGPRMGLPKGRDFFDVHPASLKIWSATYSKFAQSAIGLLKAGKKALTAFDFNPGQRQCQWCRAAKEGICAAQARAIDADMQDEAPQVVTVQEAPAKAKPKPKGKAKPKPKSKSAAPAENTAKPHGATIEDSDGTEKSQSIELTPDEIAANYAKIPMLKQMIASYEKAMHTLMYSGDGHKEYKLVEVSGGNRFITDVPGLVEMLKAARYKDAQIYDQKPLTPAAYERLTEDKPRVQKRLAAFFGKPDNKTAIAPIEDPRPEFKGASDDDMTDE